jgi:hypothetical protein
MLKITPPQTPWRPNKWLVTGLAAVMLAAAAPFANLFLGERNVLPPVVTSVVSTFSCHSERFRGEGLYSVSLALSNERYAIVRTVVSRDAAGRWIVEPGELLAEGAGEAPCGETIRVEVLYEKAKRDAQVCLSLSRLEGSPTSHDKMLAEVYSFYSSRRVPCMDLA